MKNAAFWSVTLCGSCENRRFGETYHLKHQDEKSQEARDSVNSNWQLKTAFSNNSVYVEFEGHIEGLLLE
jgi:hypothetical protein